MPSGLSPRVALQWLRDHLEVGTVLFVLALAGAGTVFVSLADEVREGETARVDEAILLALRTPGDHADPLGPLWVEEVARDITALGGVSVLTLLTLFAAGYLALGRHFRTMGFLLVSVAGGVMVSSLAKSFFDRPRPDLVPHGSIVYTASFPSGHSMMAAVTYLTLAALVARIEPRRRIKAYLLCVAVLVTLGVGASRVYLGVHWPTDVLAGWSAGAAWALLCLAIASLLDRRGRIASRRDGG